MNLSTIPEYIKNSLLYDKLLNKGITYISHSDNIPLFENVLNNESDFKNILKVIYYWKIKKPYPKELYIYMYKNLTSTKKFLQKYDNELGEYLLSFNFNPKIFLSNVVGVENNYDLIDEIANVNISINDFFYYSIQFSNLYMIKYLYNIYGDVIDKSNEMSYYCTKKNCNEYEIILFLIEKGIPFYGNHHKYLKECIEQNRMDIVNYALHRFLNEQKTYFNFPLLLRLNNRTITKFIYNNKQKLKITDFMLLCATGTLGQVKKEIKIEYVNDLDKSGHNALFYASYYEKYDILKYLVGLKISDLNHKNNIGNNILSFTNKPNVFFKKYEGFEKYFFDEINYPPDYVYNKYSYELNRIIYEDNINKFIENLDQYNNDILLIACKFNSTKIAEYCISNNIGLFFASDENTTAFTYACYYNNEILINSLIDLQTNEFLNMVDSKGKIPIEYSFNYEKLKLKIDNKTNVVESFTEGFKIFTDDDFIFKKGKSNFGGFGSVQIVKHKETGIDMAIKQYESCNNEIITFSATKEIGIQKMINKINENVSPIIYGLYFKNDCIHIVQEAMSYTLTQYFKTIKNKGETEKNKILTNILYELLVSIDVINSSGILHNDLKPANIMYDSNNKLKIIDFGLSEYLGINPHKLFLTYATSTYYIKAPEANKYIYVNTTSSENPFYSPDSIKHLNHDVFSIGSFMFDIFTNGCEKYKQTVYMNGHFEQLEFYGVTKFNKNDVKNVDDAANMLDPLLLDLFKHMLEQKSEDRWFARECLSHEYFTGVKYIRGKINEKLFYYKDIHLSTKNDMLSNKKNIDLDEISKFKTSEILYPIFSFVSNIGLPMDIFINVVFKLLPIIRKGEYKDIMKATMGLILSYLNYMFFNPDVGIISIDDYLNKIPYKVLKSDFLGKLKEIITYDNIFVFIPVDTHISYIEIELSKYGIEKEKIKDIANKTLYYLIKFIIFEQNMNFKIFDLIVASYYNVIDVPDLFHRNYELEQMIKKTDTMTNKFINEKTKINWNFNHRSI